jgi:hypothetical protein
MPKVAEIFVNVVNNMHPDLGAIYDGARNESLAEWKFRQNAMVTGSGGLAAAIPGLHLAGLAADVAFVLNRMGTAAYGIGAILGHQKFEDNILEGEDFALILAFWADDEAVVQALTNPNIADLAANVGAALAGPFTSRDAAKCITKALIAASPRLAADQLSATIAAKPAANFASKFVARGIGGFVPFVGAAVGAGLNLWLLNDIQEAAETFYGHKIKLAERVCQ